MQSLNAKWMIFVANHDIYELKFTAIKVALIVYPAILIVQ